MRRRRLRQLERALRRAMAARDPVKAREAGEALQEFEKTWPDPNRAS